MQPIFLHTVFDNKDNKPLVTGIRSGDTRKICTLWKSGKNEPVSKILSSVKIIKRLIENATPERPIVLSGFKDYFRAFSLEIRPEPYYVYDLHLPDVNTKTLDADGRLVFLNAVLDKIATRNLKDYQRTLANSAVAYQAMELSGLTVNDIPFYPQWSLKTFSGRSKSYGFNIQGFFEPHNVVSFGALGLHTLIHFDWVCADIRVASLLSGDETLQRSFETDDPYTTMMRSIQAADPLRDTTRDACKVSLLKAINSMDFTNADVISVYPTLSNWIKHQKTTIDTVGWSESILGRRFSISTAKNKLAVLNGTMQGSVAHAMQYVIRNVWEMYPRYIVADIHDSLVLSAPTDAADAIIKSVAEIMLHPFAGMLDDNPAFPLKVSIGNKWKQWKTIQIYRAGGVINVEPSEVQDETEDSAETQFESVEAETAA